MSKFAAVNILYSIKQLMPPSLKASGIQIKLIK